MLVTKELVSTGYSLRCDMCQTYFPDDPDVWDKDKEHLIVNASGSGWFISEDEEVTLCRKCWRKVLGKFVNSSYFKELVKEKDL